MQVTIDDVSKSFTTSKGSIEALSNVNLSVRSGEFLALVGASGCGKSTLLEIVAGLTRPSTGRVLLDQTPIECHTKQLSIVFQDYALFPWRTVAGNLRYVLEVHKVPKGEWAHLCQSCLDLVHLSDFQHAYPHQISGGMKQRVAIARALVAQPKVLLMDEPFAALDAITRRELQRLLLEVLDRTKKTVLFVTHSISEALSLADRIAVMTPLPGSIREIITVPGERGTRDMQSREMASLQRIIWNLLMGDSEDVCDYPLSM